MRKFQLGLWTIFVLAVVLGLFQCGAPLLAQDQTSTTTTLTIVTRTVFANQTVTTTSYIVIPSTITLTSTLYRSTFLNVTTMSTTQTQTFTSTEIYPVTAIATVHMNTTTTSTSFSISTVQVLMTESITDSRTVFLFMGGMALLLIAILVWVLRTAIRNARKKKPQQWSQPIQT